MKIAMWSGPRNLSTAMMYSFGNRADCAVTDEPFYAAYLAETGANHPMRKEILETQPNDPAEVVKVLLQPNPEQCPLWYQKHMTHHMLPGFDLAWLRGLRNVFLIRNPEKIIASYAKKRSQVSFSDLGFSEQKQIFNFCIKNDLEPIVLDSDYVLANPSIALSSLCQKLDISFDPAMITWAPGERVEDGIWAAHWYGAVHKSEGFNSEQRTAVDLPEEYRPILDEAMPIYEELRAIAIT